MSYQLNYREKATANAEAACNSAQPHLGGWCILGTKAVNTQLPSCTANLDSAAQALLLAHSVNEQFTHDNIGQRTPSWALLPEDSLCFVYWYLKRPHPNCATFRPQVSAEAQGLGRAGRAVWSRQEASLGGKECTQCQVKPWKKRKPTLQFQQRYS